MKIEFETGKPPKDGTMIVGLFISHSGDYVETCYYKDNAWLLKGNDDFYEKDPVLWTLFENFKTTEEKEKEGK